MDGKGSVGAGGLSDSWFSENPMTITQAPGLSVPGVQISP